MTRPINSFVSRRLRCLPAIDLGSMHEKYLALAVVVAIENSPSGLGFWLLAFWGFAAAECKSDRLVREADEADARAEPASSFGLGSRPRSSERLGFWAHNGADTNPGEIARAVCPLS